MHTIGRSVDPFDERLPCLNVEHEISDSNLSEVQLADLQLDEGPVKQEYTSSIYPKVTLEGVPCCGGQTLAPASLNGMRHRLKDVFIVALLRWHIPSALGLTVAHWDAHAFPRTALETEGRSC